MDNVQILKKVMFILMLFATTLFAQSEDSTRVKFDPSRNPGADVQSAVKAAGKAHKKIILDIGGEWCIWCHRIDAFITSHKEIKSYLDKNFIVVKVNYSKENKNEEFLAKYPKVPGYPHMFVLDSKGKLLHSQDTGLLENEKTYDPEKFITFLKTAHSAKKAY